MAEEQECDDMDWIHVAQGKVQSYVSGSIQGTGFVDH